MNPKNTLTGFPQPPPPLKGFTQPIGPSPLLARLQSFLPQLKAANEQLEQDIKQHGRDQYSIEQTRDQLHRSAQQNNCKLIKLDLSLGVLEEKPPQGCSNIVLPSAGEMGAKNFDMKYKDDTNDEDCQHHEISLTSAVAKSNLVEIQNSPNEDEFVQLERDIELEQDFAFATQIINPFQNITGGSYDADDDEDYEQSSSNDINDADFANNTQELVFTDIMSPVDAVVMLKEKFGYEAMGNVPVTMDLNQHAEDYHQQTMNDDEDAVQPKIVLVEEYNP